MACENGGILLANDGSTMQRRRDEEGRDYGFGTDGCCVQRIPRIEQYRLEG